MACVLHCGQTQLYMRPNTKIVNLLKIVFSCVYVCGVGVCGFIVTSVAWFLSVRFIGDNAMLCFWIHLSKHVTTHAPVGDGAQV